MPHTPKMISVRIVKWIIAWKKYILLAFWRMQSRLQVFLFPSKFESDWITSHENSLTTKFCFKIVASKVEFWASLEVTVYRITDTLKAETLVGRKGEWLLAFGKDKRISFLGVTFSFKERCMRARDKYSCSTVHVLYKIDMAPWTVGMVKHYDYLKFNIWMKLHPWQQVFETLHKNIN